MDLYTIIALVILAGPLALSFDSRVAFYQYWPGVLAASAIVGGLYIVWDSWVTRKGHWSFNPKLTGKIRIFGLPLGEILFFITVPYACLFIYEVVVSYFGDSLYFAWPAWGSWLGSGLFLVLAFLNRKRGYTFLVMNSVALFFVLQSFLFPALLGSQAFWNYMGLSLLAFLIFNGLYTALPTIWYKDSEIWGLKVGTIPAEDFFYNFSLLGLCLLVHLLFRGGLPWLG